MRNFFEHTRNPQGLGGKIMVSMMNRGHASVARWGMQHLELKDGSLVLDAGCGGGANMAAMRKRFSGGLVIGLDHSPVSAAKAEKVNRRAVAAGLCRITVGDVASLPFPDSAPSIWSPPSTGRLFSQCGASNGASARCFGS